MASHQLLSGLLDNGHLPRVSSQSRLSANDKGDNEVKPRTVHRSHGIYLRVEENPGNYQLGDRLLKDEPPVIASNEVLYIWKSVGSYRTIGRERNER